MIWETTEELNLNLAKRLQKIRKTKKITQSQLAKRSNVSLGSIKRFETTGDISLANLSSICVALGLDNELRNLFTARTYKDIDEVINEE